MGRLPARGRSREPRTSTSSRPPALSTDPNPTNFTYQNTLGYSCANGNWTQSWYTVPYLGWTLPSTINETAYTGANPVNFTVPTTDVAGIGSDRTWLGEYPIINFTSGHGTYKASYDNAFNYSAVWQFAGSQAKGAAYLYWVPGSSPAFTFNGATPPSVNVPSSGFIVQPVNFTNVPNPPTGLTLTSSTTTSLSVVWINPSGGGLLNSTVWVGSSSCMFTTAHSLGSAGTSYAITGLTTDTTYCIAVQSWNLTGGSNLSVPLLATTATVPSAPTALMVVTVTGHSITISWTNPGGGGLLNSTIYIGPSSCVFTMAYSQDPP